MTNGYYFRVAVPTYFDRCDIRIITTRNLLANFVQIKMVEMWAM